MDALLILGGITLLVVGWVWLVIRALKLSSGLLVIALLLPVVTLLLRRRGYPLWPRVLIAAGCLAALAGAGLLYREQPERFELLVSGQWINSSFRQASIGGTLMGQPFRPERVEWRGTDLVFEEGPASRVRRSLGIRFTAVPELLKSTTIERLPGDQGVWPELVLQWYTGALEAPGLKRLSGDYSLSLNFVPQGDGRVLVRIHMHLPPADATWLTGEAWLERMPAWLIELRDAGRNAARVPAIEPVVSTQPPPPAPKAPQWQQISLLALLDEPELFDGLNLRLTTWSGRVYEGQLKEVTAERRLVLAQPRGPNQVDFHFHPLDVRSIEGLYSR